MRCSSFVKLRMWTFQEYNYLASIEVLSASKRLKQKEIPLKMILENVVAE